MKKFFYACLGILCLTLAFHFGATSAQGQVGSFFRMMGGYVLVGDTIYGSTGFGWVAVSGDQLPPTQINTLIYYSPGLAVNGIGEGWGRINYSEPWNYLGQIPGGPTPTLQRSFGQVKTQFR